jgi:hypothetical protein
MKKQEDRSQESEERIKKKFVIPESEARPESANK